ncbi:Peptidase M15B domain-containing protein [Pararobbsia alpina]|uniref:D-alanyl-D-alanine carboxypeptidase family protein n=1 Tax=Pararobbsia alpina TaxID=621374 RepID=UPI0039A50B8E
MKTPLVNVDIPSIYKNAQGAPVPLPKRLAQATPDMANAIGMLAKDLQAHGGRLVLSDLFRSYEMQLQSHLDYVKGKKTAFSPPPGGSFHEAGRAMDVSLSDLHMSLSNFWDIAKNRGFVPIIDTPNASLSEAWHFECRGSHQLVIDYYRAKKGNNFAKPYTAGAASAILAIGVHVDMFGDAQKEAQLQALLIRCGHDIGNLDGAIGPSTRAALTALGLADAGLDDALAQVEALAQTKFPSEFSAPAPTSVALDNGFATHIPDHVVLNG